MRTVKDNTDSEEQSCDTLFDGELICYQYRNGYRFSIDAVLLAHFAHVGGEDTILDLGTGCGIISLLLLYRHYPVIGQVCGMEVQQRLALLAEKNLRENGFGRKSRVVHGDIRCIKRFVPAESFTSVVCNPPFYLPGSGRQNVTEESRLARHQILADLNDFLAAAALAVKNRGSVYFIYPADRLGEFMRCADRWRLEVKKMQLIYSYPKGDDTARLALFHCLKNGGRGVEVLPPFYVYAKKNGEFSSAMQNLYADNCHYRSPFDR